MDVVDVAKEIVREYEEQVSEQEKLIGDMTGVLKSYQEPLRDIIVIFVTRDWNADAFWKNLNVNQVRKTLEALDEGLKEFDDDEDEEDDEKNRKVQDFFRQLYDVFHHRPEHFQERQWEED